MGRAKTKKNAVHPKMTHMATLKPINISVPYCFFNITDQKFFFIQYIEFFNVRNISNIVNNYITQDTNNK